MVKPANRLSYPQPTRREERPEDRGDSERLDPVDVERLGLVVQRHQREARVGAERAGNLNRGLVRHALRIHEIDELLAREWPLLIEDRNVEILLQADPAFFPLTDDFLVAPLKILGA